MINQNADWRTLIDQLGADQIEEIENENRYRPFRVGRRHRLFGHIVTDQEYDIRLLEMAARAAELKRRADVNFIGIPVPAGAIAVCKPKQVLRVREDGATEMVWMRAFKGSKRVSARPGRHVLTVLETHSRSRGRN